MVLSTLRAHTLFAKLSKCLFAQPTIHFLGHIISGSGVQPDPQKVQAILDWPIPKTVTQLRAFLGLSGYYRKFIKGYATIAAPLTDLLAKSGFQWNPLAAKDFDRLKELITTAPILGLPNFQKLFVIESDASGVGIGAVLLQDDKPLAFFSRKLAPLMQGKSTYVREMFAITSAVSKWRQYLLGSPFVIRNDHKSLHNLMNQVVQTPEQQQFLSKLLGYDYMITYKSGKANIVADGLSRRSDNIQSPPLAQFAALTAPTANFTTTLQSELITDPHAAQIIQDIQNDPTLWPGWIYKNKLLFHGHRIYVPATL